MQIQVVVINDLIIDSQGVIKTLDMPEDVYLRVFRFEWTFSRK